MSKKLVISTTILVALLLPFIIPASITLAAPNPFEKFDPSIQDSTNSVLNRFDLLTPSTTQSTAGSTAPLITTNKGSSNACDINLRVTAFEFMSRLLVKGGALLAAGGVTGLLSGIPIVGGAFQSIDQGIDFVFNWWMIALLVGILASFSATIAGGLVNYALVLNANLTANNPIINIGHGTVLGLVNLGLVLAIVVIAFATMFRWAGWDAKSALTKLIIAILLINFSLFFAGLILNVGTQLTKVLLSNACAGNLVTEFNIATINENIDTLIGASGGNIVEKGFLLILSIFFASLLTAIGAATLFGIFLFLIARYVAVMILLIFMPIIWLGLIFPKLNIPGLGNAWNGWWDKFLKWVLQGPIIAFFLYLTVELIKNIGAKESQLAIAGTGPVQVIGQMLVIVILSLGGLYAANKLSIAGAAMIYGGVAKLGGMGLAGLKSTGKKTAARFGNSILGSEMGRKMTAGMQKTSFLRPIGRQLNTLGAKTEKIVSEDKFKDLSPQRLAAMVPALHGPDRVSALLKLAKGGDVNELKDLDKHLNKETEALFESYGKRFDEVEKVIGMDIATYQLLKESNALEKAGDMEGAKEAKEAAKKAATKFIAGLNPKDYSKLRINDTFDNDKLDAYGLPKDMNKDIREVQASALVNNPGAINKAGTSIKSKNFSNYTNAILESKIPEQILVETKQEILHKSTNVPAIGISIKEAKENPEKYTVRSEQVSMSKEEALKKFRADEKFRETLIASFKKDLKFAKAFDRLIGTREAGTIILEDNPQVPI